MKKSILFSLFFLITTQTSAFDEKIRNTCNAGDSDNLSLMITDVPSSVLNLPLNEMSDYFLRRGVSGVDVWVFMGLHSYNIRKVAYNGQVRNTQKIIKMITQQDVSVEEHLNFLKNSPWTYSEATKQYTIRSVERVFEEEESAFDTQVNENAAKICLRYLSFSCKDAIFHATKTMNTHTMYSGNAGYYVSAPHLIKEIFTDESYGRAMVNVASVVHDRANRLTAENETTSTDTRAIDQLLVDEFLEQGLSIEEARERMLKIMGLYGTRGASIDNLYTFMAKGNYMAYIAMQIIFSGITLLDYENTTDTKQVSLPQEASTSCLYGNAYHFWMAAYLTNELKKAGYSERSSFYAVHILTVGYQMFARAGGRDPSLFFWYSTDSWYLNYMRTTVTMNDVGAKWGLTADSDRDWNIDIRHTLMLTKYKPRKKEFTEEEMEKIMANPINHYLAWTKEIPHDSFLNKISIKK